MYNLPCTLCIPLILVFQGKLCFLLKFFSHIDHCLFPHAGYYTCVEVIFTLRRQVGFYMMGVYAPTLLIVVLSWLSFWINPDASAARVPLGMDYFKSIDKFHIFHWYFMLDPKVFYGTWSPPVAYGIFVFSIPSWYHQSLSQHEGLYLSSMVPCPVLFCMW